MAFLNEKFQERGALRYYQYKQSFETILSEGFSGGGCQQVYRAVIGQYSQFAHHKSTEQLTDFAVIRLDRADALSVAILQPEAESRTSFAVVVNKIAYNSQRGFHPQAPATVDSDSLERAGLIMGQVLSVDATSMTLRESATTGIPLRINVDKSFRYYLGEFVAAKKLPRGKLADILPGDRVQVFNGYGNNYRVYIGKGVGIIATALPDPEVLLPATSQVGAERKAFVFGYTRDRADAERLAKAMIHAISLCQATTKSPF